MFVGTNISCKKCFQLSVLMGHALVKRKIFLYFFNTHYVQGYSFIPKGMSNTFLCLNSTRVDHTQGIQ